MGGGGHNMNIGDKWTDKYGNEYTVTTITKDKNGNIIAVESIGMPVFD
jgi:hypothetical protein